MKAKLLFLVLSDEMAEEINAKGWNGTVANKAYADATMLGKVEAAKTLLDLGIYMHVATVEAKGSEEIFMKAQNLTENGWVQDGVVSDFVTYIDPEVFAAGGTKSMSVGDLIEWEDGTKEMVASFGFKKVE